MLYTIKVACCAAKSSTGVAITVDISTNKMNNKSQLLRTDELTKVCAYLEDPVACGLWRMEATWIPFGGISSALTSALELEIAGKEMLVISSGKRVRRIKINEAWKSNTQRNICLSLSFILHLFNYLASDPAEEIRDYSEEHEFLELLLDIIDIQKIRDSYAPQIKFFKENIWLEQFRPVFQIDKPARVKTGALIVTEAPRDNNIIAALSWDGAPLVALRDFLSSLGKIEEGTVMPVFSPEEHIFAPYFTLLGLAASTLIKQQHLRPLVEKAISNFQHDEFIDCVGTIGLAAEDVLTQIFETLFREQLVKGLTLGQLLDEINSRAAAKFKKKDEAPPDLSHMYTEIKAAIDDPNADVTRALSLLRQLVTISIELQKFSNKKIENLSKKERAFSIFPEKLNANVVELIRYRNAASHKSRVPVGPNECRRAAFSFVALNTWWAKEKVAIDWSQSAEQILKSCVDRGS